MPATRAALILPDDDDIWAVRCLARAHAEGAEVTAICHCWEEWVALCKRELVELAVVPRWDMLPPGRTPRVVSLEDEPVAPPDPHGRRPRIAG